MKSILVDALRQANGEETDGALSDSGSFDASNQEFEATANDEVSEGELELMSTTNALVIHDDSEHVVEEPAVSDEPVGRIELETDAEPVDDEHAITIAGMAPLPARKHNAPRIARLSPLFCIVIAVIVAVSWLALQQIGVSRGTVGAVVGTSGSDVVVPADGDDEVARFPFLDNGRAIEPEDSAR